MWVYISDGKTGTFINTNLICRAVFDADISTVELCMSDVVTNIRFASEKDMLVFLNLFKAVVDPKLGVGTKDGVVNIANI